MHDQGRGEIVMAITTMAKRTVHLRLRGEDHKTMPMVAVMTGKLPVLSRNIISRTKNSGTKITATMGAQHTETLPTTPRITTIHLTTLLTTPLPTTLPLTTPLPLFFAFALPCVVVDRRSVDSLRSGTLLPYVRSARLFTVGTVWAISAPILYALLSQSF